MGFLQRAHMFLYFSASKIRQQIPQKQGGKERKVHKKTIEKKKKKFLYQAASASQSSSCNTACQTS